MMIRVVNLTVVFIVLQVQSCCLPSQSEIREAAEKFYRHEQKTINPMPFAIQEICIVNIRKYTCDSLTAYVRVKGAYSHKAGKQGKFDIARRLTVIRTEGKCIVVSEEVVR